MQKTVEKTLVIMLISALLILLTTVSLVQAPTPPMYWKASYADYAPSGMPDFDQRQVGTYNWTDIFGVYSHCAPTAAANSLWWLDSKYEINANPPPAISDSFSLVTSYLQGIDDHDRQNVQPFIEHLAYLMDTDGRRTGIVHSGTIVNDMQAGITQYLSWTGVNPKGDVDGDGLVNQQDLNLVLGAVGSQPGSPLWNIAYDIYPSTLGWPTRGLADNVIDAHDADLVRQNMGGLGIFYEHTVPAPTFEYVEQEVERSQDVVLLIGFWQWTGSQWYRIDYPYPNGHAVTVAGINSSTLKIAISDPMYDAYEKGQTPEGRIPVAHPHPPPEPPFVTHNNASLVSQDIYNTGTMPPPPPPPLPPCPGGIWRLINYPGAPAGVYAVVEYAVITSPRPPMPELYYKGPYPDYALSGVPDFDERQWFTYNWSNPQWGVWSHCSPTAVANSLWWLDSEFETNTIPPPTPIDNFNLVTSYIQGVDDHDPQNVQPLIEHLAYLMDTDGLRTQVPHTGTNVNDMQAGLAQYMAWTGVNPPGDVDGDGVVTSTDVSLISAAVGSAPGSPGWNMMYDIFPVTLGWPNKGLADNVIDPNDMNLALQHVGQTARFNETTVFAPEFSFVEQEFEKCEDVVLNLGFWYYDGINWYREEYPYPYPNTGINGHSVTVAGINSTSLKIAISDPALDAFENGLIIEGRIPYPHGHAPVEPPYVAHNNASLVSQDIYNVSIIPPQYPPCPGGSWAIEAYPPNTPSIFAIVESAVITSPYGIHDVAITDLSSIKTIIGTCSCHPHAYGGNVTVTVQNVGDFTEQNVSFTVYANETAINTATGITLAPSASSTLTFKWDGYVGSGFAHGNYTLKAAADRVSGELDIHMANNNYTCGTAIHSGVPGDVTGPTPEVYDGRVDMRDITYMILRFQLRTYGNPDLNNDGVVDIREITAAILHFMQPE